MLFYELEFVVFFEEQLASERYDAGIEFDAGHCALAPNNVDKAFAAIR